MVVLGLGSNVGDRLAYLQAAVGHLCGLLSDVRMSRILESTAILPDVKVEGMERPFYNMVIAGHTTLSPGALIVELKGIEKALGRVQRCVWGPREIDIDILAMDEKVVREEGLAIPHLELLNRDFALLPFADVAPDWRYPVEGAFFGLTLSQLIARKHYALNADLKETGLRIS